MFLPQVAEEDVFDANGKQVDDINSVIEYVEVVLGYDHHADDEDDDNGQNFHLVKNIEYSFQQSYFAIEPAMVSTVSVTVFYNTNDIYFQSIALDIISPPPDLLSA